MAYEIPPDLQSFINEQIHLGCFGSAEQVVTEALRLLKAERDETLAGIQQGLADAAAGRTQPLAEAFADLRRNLSDSD